MTSISYLLMNLRPDNVTNVYTVGAPNGYGFYIQIPWHLRGTASELMDQFGEESLKVNLAGESVIPPECLGFEFRDNGVQIERHRFPWRDAP